VRRRVGLDSDTEVPGLMANLDARRESTARVGPAAQLDSQEEHQNADAVLDNGGDRPSSEAGAAQPDKCTQSRDAVRQPVSSSIGHRRGDAHANGLPATAARHAAAADEAGAAVTAARLAELIASASPLLPETGPSLQLFRAADCSVIRMPVPLRFKDDTNVPLHR